MRSMRCEIVFQEKKEKLKAYKKLSCIFQTILTQDEAISESKVIYFFIQQTQVNCNERISDWKFTGEQTLSWYGKNEGTGSRRSPDWRDVDSSLKCERSILLKTPLIFHPCVFLLLFYPRTWKFRKEIHFK